MLFTSCARPHSPALLQSFYNKDHIPALYASLAASHSTRTFPYTFLHSPWSPGYLMRLLSLTHTSRYIAHVIQPYIEQENRLPPSLSLRNCKLLSSVWLIPCVHQRAAFACGFSDSTPTCSRHRLPHLRSFALRASVRDHVRPPATDRHCFRSRPFRTRVRL
ncbi:hypothetical protein EDB89DRAFT_224678 [Lactarius sanguifluus]|nr:hypothetical protein EDB89DRAFT_224678 [Lactarius sanguifluus]